MSKFPLTIRGAEKLRQEVNHLKFVERPRITAAIAEARAHGDLKENAEYHAAKERQGMVNARLQQLKSRLREVSMIDFTKIPHDRVGLGSIVTVMDLIKDEEMVYTLVMSEEANAASGKISTSSPIGRGLLNKEVGDTVKVQIPGGLKELEIVKLTTVHQIVK